MSRSGGRLSNEIRDLKITNRFLEFSEGSVLIEMGHTKVLCTAKLEERVPPFLKGTGRGWLTAEYSMLPGSTPDRTARENSRGGVGGRTHEIQRLIGRSLRAVTNLDVLGERQIYIDCDVLQADGGTRTASITGAFIALAELCRSLVRKEIIAEMPLLDFVSAVSVGVVDGEVLLDLEYVEDSQAEVDMNVVMTGSGRFIEVQGTAEGEPFERSVMERLIDLASEGIRTLIEKQEEILGDVI
ncbi:MAG: ribonuclease PH [Deltaproteobacteria bacterium]|jgi:ribonuclease PH|nr:ribonuclease PH [Deltaproteobacteria bacterium]